MAPLEACREASLGSESFQHGSRLPGVGSMGQAVGAHARWQWEVHPQVGVSWEHWPGAPNSEILWLCVLLINSPCCAVGSHQLWHLL